METRTLYQIDAYIRAFDAEVVGVQGDAVVLDATAFYPGGGGQPHDLGRLTDATRAWIVTKAAREGALVWHTLDAAPPAQGARVRRIRVVDYKSKGKINKRLEIAVSDAPAL